MGLELHNAQGFGLKTKLIINLKSFCIKLATSDLQFMAMDFHCENGKSELIFDCFCINIL